MRNIELKYLCSPKQWKTVTASNLISNGYPVYGANGIIGYHTEYNHEFPTILVTCRGATCGEVNICKPFSYVNGNAMALDDLDVSKINIKYLYYYLKHRGFKDIISGSAQPQIIRSTIEKIKIPLIELEIQEKIVETLDKVNCMISKRQSQITALDELTQSLFLEMFGDPAKNPKNYQLSKLKDLCIKITDGTHHSPPMVENGMPYVSAKHLGKGYLDFYSNPAYISKEEHQKIYKRCDPVKGDILYIKDGATTGIAGINHYDFEFSMLSSLALIRPYNDLLNNYYLVHYLNNERVKNNIISNMSGGAIKRLTIKKINDLLIVVPPIELQREFAEKIKKINKQKVSFKASLEQMNILYNSLLQKAFKGELFQE